MTKVIDFANLDFAALRKSVELESRSDLMAVAGDIREAAHLMKEANRVRVGQFGPWNPNELRDFTVLALQNARETTVTQEGSDG